VEPIFELQSDSADSMIISVALLRLVEGYDYSVARTSLGRKKIGQQPPQLFIAENVQIGEADGVSGIAERRLVVFQKKAPRFVVQQMSINLYIRFSDVGTGKIEKHGKLRFSNALLPERKMGSIISEYFFIESQ
jgi:hypothetical protein